MAEHFDRKIVKRKSLDLWLCTKKKKMADSVENTSRSFSESYTTSSTTTKIRIYSTMETIGNLKKKNKNEINVKFGSIRNRRNGYISIPGTGGVDRNFSMRWWWKGEGFVVHGR